MDDRVDNEELLQMAINAVKRRQRDGARMMLRQLLARDKRNESAMLWLAKIARNSTERAKWLERVVAVNAENETAQKALERMRYQQAAVENRMLLVFGSASVVMLILTIFIIIVAFTA